MSRTVPFRLSYDELTSAIRLFNPYRDGAPRVRLEEGCLTWRDRVFSSRFVFFRRRRTEWVKAAADRLEALLFLVRGDAATTPAVEALAPDSGRDGKEHARA